ncbi:MAG: hypothetical protein ACK4IS_00480 [Erythrobacter sp.]
MNHHTPDLADAKRDALRARIEAAERRIAERRLVDDARDAARAAADYARANPGKVVAGALVLGLVIGLLTTPGRAMVGKAASRMTGSASRKASGAMSEAGAKLGALLANALVAQGLKVLDEMLDGAATGKERASDLLGKAASEAQRIGREAAETSGDLARRSRAAAETAARDIARRVGK